MEVRIQNGVRGMKQPIHNLEEKIGRVVGKNVSGAVDYDRLVAAAKATDPPSQASDGTISLVSSAPA
jgi:hypothetical protein